MKKFSLAFGLMLTAQVGLRAQSGLMAQNGNLFHITGQLQNLKAVRIYLIYFKEGRQVLDSATVDNGAYVLTGELTESSPATLLDVSPLGGRTPAGDIAEIYLTPESFSVTHIDSFSNTVIAGSMLNTDFKRLLEEEKPYRQREMALLPAYQAARQAKDDQTIRSIEAQVKAIRKGMDDTVYAPFARNHPQSPLALHVLQLYAQDDPDAPALPTLFNSLSSVVRGSAAGKAFAHRLAIAAKTAIGATAMDFTQNDTLGKPVSLSAFRGRYVLLDFWASWCGPCRLENPNIVSAYTRYHGKGFDILSVSLDRPGDMDKWIKAIRSDGLTWTHVSDLRFWQNAAAVEYGVQSIPQNFLIDPQGKIIGKGLRGDELEKKLSQVYKN